jgi:hemerythrin-like domain-containing protein
MTAPRLLNDDGTASMATMIMSSHHAFRRDLARLARALQAQPGPTDAQLERLRLEWQWFRGALHGHHESEDTRMFPFMREQQPQLAATFDRLGADHRAIDPLLEQGDRAFGAPFAADAARAAVAALQQLLDRHLALEEAEAVPLLRPAKQFPSPANDEEAEQYAQGFAWSLYGLAPAVVGEMMKLLPESLTSRLPTAREAFAARFLESWGEAMPQASTTSTPAA